jgi:general secretion pathway protein K
MALLMVLAAISFLVAVTVQLGSSVNVRLTGSAIQTDLVRLDAQLRSLAALIRAGLLTDQIENEFDSLYDSWAVLDHEAVANLLEGEQTEFTVEDLSGRLQVNALVLSEEEKKEQEKKESGAGGSVQEQQGEEGEDTDAGKEDKATQQRRLWLQLLQQERIGLSEEEAVNLVDAISDWIDQDEEVRDHGAENGYYRSLSPPYVARNGPVQYLEELLLIKGMNATILYGDKEHSGIIDYLTILGNSGTININTAPGPVLEALHPNMNEELALDLIAYREEERNREQLANAKWYGSVGGFPGDIVFDEDLLTVKSSYFALHMVVGAANLKRQGKVWIERQENHQQNILLWKVD